MYGVLVKINAKDRKRYERERGKKMQKKNAMWRAS